MKDTYQSAGSSDDIILPGLRKIQAWIRQISTNSPYPTKPDPILITLVSHPHGFPDVKIDLCASTLVVSLFFPDAIVEVDKEDPHRMYLFHWPTGNRIMVSCRCSLRILHPG